MYKYKVFKKPVIYLLLFLLTAISIFPLLWGVASSLRTDTELYKYAMPFSAKTLIPQEPTFDAYWKLFAEYNFLKPILNTLTVTGACIVFGCLINSIAAFAFAVFDFRFKSVIFAMVLMSFMIPFEAIALPLYGVVNSLGWVSTRHGIIIPGIANGLVLFLFTQFFKDISRSLMEAARVDGASLHTIFIRIVVPLSIPVFITASLMIFMSQWNSYLWPLLVARGREIRMIQTALNDFQTEHGTLWSLLYAGSMVSALIPIFLFLPFQKYFIEGVTSGAVKE